MIAVTTDITPAINFALQPLPNHRRERAHQLINLAVSLLPAVEDDVIASMIEELAIALSEAEDAISTERQIGNAATSLAHDQRVKFRLLQERYAAALGELQAARRAA